MVRKSFLSRLLGRKSSSAARTPPVPGGSTATATKQGASKQAATGRGTTGQGMRETAGPREIRPGNGKGAAARMPTGVGVPPSGRTETGRTETGRTESRASHARPVQPLPRAGLIEPEPRSGGNGSKAGENRPGSTQPTRRSGKEVEAGKMSPGEEIGLTISKGLKGLSHILTDIDQKLDDQSRKSTELVETVKVLPEVMKDLPETSRAGVELLTAITKALEKQATATQEASREVTGRVKEMTGKVQDVVEAVDKVPAMVQDLGQKIEDRVERSDARRAALTQSVDRIRKNIEEVSREQLQAQQRTVEELRRAHAREDERIREIQDRSRTQTRILGGLLILVALAFLALLSKL